MRLFGSVALTYHGVAATAAHVHAGRDPHRLVVSTDNLDSHIRVLKRLGYRFVRADALIGDERPRGRVVALTFDDGFSGWVEHALPVLVAHAVPGSFYVCPGWFGGQHPDVAGAEGRLLDEADLKVLAAAGMEVGSHAMTHPDLTTLDPTTLDQELTASKATIENVLGMPCRTIAYPFGIHDPRVMAATERAGYELAWAWQPGPWQRFSAPRLPAPARNGGRRLALKLGGLRRYWAP